MRLCLRMHVFEKTRVRTFWWRTCALAGTNNRIQNLMVCCQCGQWVDRPLWHRMRGHFWPHFGPEDRDRWFGNVYVDFLLRRWVVYCHSCWWRFDIEDSD